MERFNEMGELRKMLKSFKVRFHEMDWVRDDFRLDTIFNIDLLMQGFEMSSQQLL